jgi:hypothetical protein
VNRVVLVALVLAAAGAAHASPPSNPAFLGVGMDDYRNVCIVSSVTEGSPAEDSGIALQDLVEAVDGVATASCTEVTDQIIAHAPGDKIEIVVMRGGGQRVRLHPVLTSRTEVLQRRYVGKPVPDFDITGYDDGQPVDLARPSSETRVLAWFDVHHCEGCAPLLERVGSKAKLEVITYGDSKHLATDRVGAKLGVPVALFRDVDEFRRTAMGESDRIYFMVVDCHGIVRFVVPIVPDADDADAAIDDVLAAVDQTQHAHLR